MGSNRILAAIDPSLRKTLIGAGRRFQFYRGDIVSGTGDRISDVLFPLSGAISLAQVLDSGDCIAAAVIGREGAIGAEVAFGASTYSCSSTAQLMGVGLLVPARIVVEAGSQDEQLQRLLFSSHHYGLLQSQQTAACNSRHKLAQRLASWLIRISDSGNSSVLFLTQEHMAALLGATRASVSVAAAALARLDAIEYERGTLRIANRDILSSHACECHRRIQRSGCHLLSEGVWEGGDARDAQSSDVQSPRDPD